MLRRELRVRSRLKAPRCITLAAGLALAAGLGACGSSASVSSGPATSTTQPSGASPPAGPSPGAGTPASVPVVAATSPGLRRLKWDQVSGIRGQQVELSFLLGGCVGPPLQATVTSTSSTVAVSLWDKPARPGEVCADYIVHGSVSVDLPSPLAGRTVVNG